ncbi:hypothetical protein GYB22_12095 [bacterium]|nr:hypothetical protein [bacterium]
MASSINYKGNLRNITLILLFTSFYAFSQEREEKRPAFISISSGVNFSSFRDFATSPLIYSGTPIYTSISHLDLDQERESQISLSYSFGKYKSDFNNQNTESKVNTISLNYLELFEVKNWSSPKLNLKVGGQFNAIVNIRNNEDFFNNSEGVDIISNLFGSVKATLDLSRDEEVKKKFLFINYTAQKRSQNLSFGLNMGLVNGAFRNGFAYTSSSAPINTDEFFADYELKIFKGFRINTVLDYTYHLHNNNAVRISYLWDAFKTAGYEDNFEMANHIIKCSLLFSLR